MTSSPRVSAKPSPRIATADEAERLISHLCDVMDALVGLVEEETALVRAGRQRETAKLEPAKTDMARLYLADVERLKASAEFLAATARRRALTIFGKRHSAFRAVLQINLTVLATAHAVSESIIRGVAGELARKAAPQTYGASGRQVRRPGERGAPGHIEPPVLTQRLPFALRQFELNFSVVAVARALPHSLTRP